MKLVIMTKPTFFVEEDKILSALFDEGLESLHLKKTGSSPLFSERLLSLLPDYTHSKITVHDHFYLKNEYHLAAIHLEDPSMGVPLGYKGKVGIDCKDLTQLRALKKQANYVFLKNVFDSTTMPSEKASFSLNELRQASRMGLIDKKVYAIGCMCAENIEIARELGFGGVVVSGDIWNRFDIHSEIDYKHIISHFIRLRKAVDG